MLLLGARRTLIPAKSLTSMQLPSLPDMSALQEITIPPTQRSTSSPDQTIGGRVSYQLPWSPCPSPSRLGS